MATRKPQPQRKLGPLIDVARVISVGRDRSTDQVVLRWTAITLVLFASVLNGCSTYVARLTLQPAQKELTGEPTKTRSFGEKETTIAREVIVQIADQYEMRMMPGPFDPGFTKPWRVLSMFCGTGSMRIVCLSASIKDDRSEISFVVADQVHGSETEFTSALWRSLEEEVEKQLPGFTVAEEKSSIIGSPLAP